MGYCRHGFVVFLVASPLYSPYIWSVAGWRPHRNPYFRAKPTRALYEMLHFAQFSFYLLFFRSFDGEYPFNNLHFSDYNLASGITTHPSFWLGVFGEDESRNEWLGIKICSVVSKVGRRKILSNPLSICSLPSRLRRQLISSPSVLFHLSNVDIICSYTPQSPVASLGSFASSFSIRLHIPTMCTLPSRLYHVVIL